MIMAADRRVRSDPPLILVGTDFRCAPLELREQVSRNPEEAEELLVHLLARQEVAEAYLLSTCNRTEIYVLPRDEDGAYATAVDLVFAQRLEEMTRPGRLYVHRDGEAAHHLLAVASGLESMVLGEPEILGQVRQASSLAEAVGASGTLLRRLLRTAGSAGKRARAETAISEGAVSLGYTVVELAKNIYTDFEASRVLVVGAGETARMVSRNLLEKGIEDLTVSNRGQERLASYQQEFPLARAVPFDQRIAAAAAADIVVVTTGAEEPVLTRGHLKAAMKERPSRKLLVVDLGVPRNVEPSAAKIENLFLHSIDSLEKLVERNLKKRRAEVPRVEEIIAQELTLFRAWYRGLEAEPLVARLQKQAERIRQQELAAARLRFPEDTHEDLERLTRALVRKILHHPSATLRRAGGREDSLPRLDLVRELFRLDEEEERS
jgi:glutamyl-tRNA reductase